MSTARLLCGDALAVLKTLPEGSVDAIVTDPPYHLTTGKAGGSGDASVNLKHPGGRARVTTGFMGKKWDGGDVAFRPETWHGALRVTKPGSYLLAFGGTRTYHRMTCAIEDAGWEIQDCLSWLYGSGFPKHESKLKPAWEPIIMARKPDRRATPLNIDDCRIAGPKGDGVWGTSNQTVSQNRKFNASPSGAEYRSEQHSSGRWPANVALDEEAAELLDGQSGELVSGANPTRRRSDKSRNTYSAFEGQRECEPARGVDVGGASRFFYCAKASRAEREAGIVRNTHPTVKPVALMRWLVRLVTPVGGVVLDPFTGSGTTGIAAILEDRSFIGIEKEAAYVAIAEQRIAHAAAQPSLFT